MFLPLYLSSQTFLEFFNNNNNNTRVDNSGSLNYQKIWESSQWTIFFRRSDCVGAAAAAAAAGDPAPRVL